MLNQLSSILNQLVACHLPREGTDRRPHSAAGLRHWVRIAPGLLLMMWLLVVGMSEIARGDDLLDRPLRHIFVPLEDFDAVMARDRQGVLLKRSEFEALVDKATQTRSTEVRPTGLVVSTANYAAKIDGDQLVLTATINLAHFDKSWSEIQIPTEGLSVEKCLINGQPALAGWHAENPNILRVYTDLEGSGTLSLELSARLIAVGSDLTAAFGIIPAASGELVVSLPAGKFLQESNNTLPRGVPADQPAEYRIALGGHRSVNLQITNRQASERTDLLTLANTAISVVVAPGEVSWGAKSAIHVVGRPVDRMVCTVPKSLEITAVESIGLDSWQLADIPDDPTRTSISLAYRQSFDGMREIQFRGVLKADTDVAWEVPTLVFNEIASQVGIAEVRYPAGVRLRVGELDGVRAVVHQAVSADNGDSLLHFQIWNPHFKLPFVTEPKSREVRSAVTYLLDLNPVGLDLSAVINFQTRLAPLFDVQVNLPADWQVRTVYIGDQSVPWQLVPLQAGTNQVQVLLPTPVPVDGTVSVTINAGLEPTGWPVTETPLSVKLPQVEIPQAAIVEGLYGITAQGEFDVVPAEITGLDSPSPEELQLLRTKVAALQRDLRQAFSLQDSRYSGQLQITRKPARLSSQESTFFRIEPDSLASHIEARLIVEGGGVRQLVLDLPESAGTDLRFAISPVMVAQPVAPGGQGGGYLAPIPPRIVEQTSAPPRQGLRRWTLRLDRFALGTFLLSVNIRQPRPASGPFQCPALTVIGAERETGFIAIEASQEQYLSPRATDISGQSLTQVDPIDFPQAAYTPRIPVVAGYRYNRPGWSVAVSEQRFDRSSVHTAIGHAAHHQSVLGHGGELQHQTSLEFTAIGVQNLKVKLPEGVILWSVQLDNQPQEIRQQGDGLLVAVPQTTQTDQRHTLTLIYRSPVKDAALDDFRQAPPSFTVLDGQGAEQPLHILKQSWTLHHPDSLLLIDSPGAFQPTHDLDQDGMLGQWSSLLRAPSPTHLRDTALVAAIAFLVIWGLRKAVDRFGWKQSIAGSLSVGLILFCVMIVSTYDDMTPSASVAEKTSVAVSPAAPMSPMPAAPPPANIVNNFGGMGGGSMDDGVSEDFSGTDALSSLPQPPAAPQDAPASAPANEPFGAPSPSMSESMDMAGESAKKELSEDLTFQDEHEFAKDHDTKSDAAAGMQYRSPVQAGTELLEASEKPQAIERKSLPAIAVIQPKLGGLLSLALSLTPPEDSTAREFTFFGREGANSDLHLRFTNRNRSRDVGTLVTASVIVCFWFLRRASLRARTALVALLIIGSIAIAPLLSTQYQPIVDGLFFGGCVVVALSLLLAIAYRCWRRCCPTTCSPSTMTMTSALVLLAALLSTSNLRADEPPEKAEKKGPARISEPHVVWPYSGDDPSAADRVYIPQALFREMWLKAHPEEAPQAPSPVDGMIVEALHAAAFEQTGDTAIVHVKSRFVAINLRENQISLPLPVREIALKTATINGQSAVLQAEGPAFQVVLAHKGLHVLDVEFDLPATTEGPAGQFVLKTLPTAAGKLSVQLPKIMGDRDLRVNGATGAYRIRDNENGPVLDTAIDRGGDVTVSWKPRTIRGGGNTIVQVDTGEAIVVDDLGLQVNHHFQYRVRQGALTEVTFETTPHMTIREISGPDVGGWQLDDAQGTTRRLRVFLRRTVEDQTQIVIDLFSPLAVTDTPQTLPITELIPTDATREIGQIGLFAGTEFLLRAGDIKGAAQIDVGKFVPVAVPHRPEAAPIAAYRFSTRPASLSITVSRQQPESKCVVEHAVEIGPRKQSWASRLLFELTGAPRPSVSIDLPPGYLLMDVGGAEFVSDWYDSPAADGHRLLTVEFDQPRLGQVEILLEGVIPRPTETPTIELLAPQPIGVGRLNSSLAVWLSDVYSATISSAESWRAMSPDQLSHELQQLRPTPAQFAFRASGTVSQPIIVEMSRQVAQMSADLVILAAVADESVDYGLTIRWKISRAATDRFQFTTPDWLKGRLELNVPGVRQIDTTPTENGEILWTIQLIDAVKSQFLCTGIVSLPPPAEDVIQIPDIAFLDPASSHAATRLESQRRCAIVVNRSTGQLVSVDDRLVNKLPVDQLPLVVDSVLLKQALAVTELSAQLPLPKWKLVRPAVQEAGRATVTGSDLVTSITWDGTWRTRAVYTIRNRGQQFLGLRVPTGAQLMSVFVKGLPSRTVTTTLNEETIHLVPLPQTSVVDLSFQVQVTIAGTLPEPLEHQSHLAGQEVSLPAPDIVSRKQSEDFGLTVAHTSWRVFVPDKLDVTLVGNARSNMDQLIGDELFASLEIQRSSRLKADVEELVRVLNDSRSDGFRRAQSLQNLKQLENDVRVQGSVIEQRGRPQENTSKLYDQAKNLNDLLLEEVTRGSSLGDQQSAQQSVSPNSSSGSGSGDNRDFIIANNGWNFSGNSVGDGISMGVTDSEFKFKLSRDEASDKKAEGRQDLAKSKQSRGRGALRKSLEIQSYSNSAANGVVVQGEAQQLDFNSAGQSITTWSSPGVRRADPSAVNFGFVRMREQEVDQVWDANTVRPYSATPQGENSGVVVTRWSNAGGLSLPFDLPSAGHETVYSKIGGEPQLTLSLRPRQTWTRSLTWLWSLCWGLLALWLARRFMRASSAATLRPVFGFTAVLGALGFVLLEGGLSSLGFMIFIISLIAVFLIGAKQVDA